MVAQILLSVMGMHGKARLWPYVLSLAGLALAALITAWLGYACTFDTPPACPLDPGFVWTTDFTFFHRPAYSGSKRSREGEAATSSASQP